MAALAGGLLLIALLAGCSEGGSDEPRAITALPSATPTPAAVGTGALPLERFHYVASLTLRQGSSDGDQPELSVSTEGDFVWPDRHAFSYRTRLGEGELEERLVLADGSVWYRRGEEPWRETNVDDERVAELLDVAFSTLRPDFLAGEAFERVRANVLGLPSAEEFVNDVRAYHYEVGTEGRVFLESLQMGEDPLRAAKDLEWDLWLARDGGWPVRILAQGTVTVDLTILNTLELKAPTAWEIRIDVSRPNDPALAIATPEAG